MNIRRKKIALLLFLLVSGWVVCTGCGAETDAENAIPPSTPVEDSSDAEFGGESAAGEKSNAIPYKKSSGPNRPEISSSYIGLLIFVVVLLLALTYLRKRLGLNPYKGVAGNRIELLERKKIGPQTHMSLIAVDDRLFTVVESAAGVALSPLESSATDSRDVNSHYDVKLYKQHPTET